MARIHNVEVDVDMDIDEIYDSLSYREKEKLVTLLAEEGYDSIKHLNANGHSANCYFEALEKLKNNSISVTPEEESIIISIAKKF